MFNTKNIKTIAYGLSYAAFTSAAVPFLGYKSVALFDQLCGTSYLSKINEVIDKYLKVDKLKTNSESNKLSDILYNASIVFYGNSVAYDDIKQEIMNFYQKLEQHPTLKYYLYVNALHLKENDEEITFLDRGSWMYKCFKFSQSFVGGHDLEQLGGFTASTDNTISIIFENTLTAFSYNTIAHEMTHSAYGIVYKNSAKPYSSNDFVMNDEFLNCLTGIYKYTKNLQSKVFGKVKEGSADKKFLNIVSYFASESSSVTEDTDLFIKESIAHYLGEVAEGDEEVASKFVGFKEYVQKNTIPDFIKYIESHPKCHEISYSDDSIQCGIAGESYISSDKEL